MKKLFLCLIILFPILASCTLPNTEPRKTHHTITLINQTNKFLVYSFIYDTTTATSSNEFYSQSHNYVRENGLGTVQKWLISPAGTTVGEDRLDKDTLWFDTGSYYVTLFVCIDNMYTGRQDQYLNKKRIYISSDSTIIIGANGSIY